MEDCPTNWEPRLANLVKEYPDLARHVLLAALEKTGGHVGQARNYLRQQQAQTVVNLGDLRNIALEAAHSGAVTRSARVGRQAEAPSVSGALAAREGGLQGGPEAAAGSGLDRSLDPGASASRAAEQPSSPSLSEKASEQMQASQHMQASQQMPPHLERMSCDEEGDMSSVDVNGDRRVICAAATFGSVAGSLLAGPATGVALGAAALYAAAREDGSGAMARRAGAAYLRVQDCAIDSCLQAMDQGAKALGEVAERGAQQLSREVDLASMPAPVRAGVAAVLSHRTQRVKGSCEEASRIRERYPDRVPIICERSPYNVALPELAQSKFLVPGGMACGEFKYMIHRHLAKALSSDRGADQTIYIFVDGLAPKTSTPMSELYSKFCAEDGFLYITYGAENTLG